MSSLETKPSGLVKDFGSCASCSLKLCSTPSPQLLPCLHSLCRDCFTLPDKTEDSECPDCQVKYKLQEVVSNLVFSELSSVSRESIKCGGCENISVTGWCIECQESLCAVCVAAHQRVRIARQHFVHEITQEFPRPVVCPIHKKTQVNSYCLTCHQLACRHCPPSHHNHLLQDVSEAVLQQKRQIQRMVQKVQPKRLAAQKSLATVEGRLSDLEDLEMQVRMQVMKTVVSLCKVIIKKAAKHLTEMEDLCGKERKKLADHKVRLQHLQKKQDHVLAFTDKALESEDHTVLLSCKTQIHHQLQQLLDQNVFSPPTVLELNFQCNRAKLKKALKTFGCIVARQVPSASSSIIAPESPPPSACLQQSPGTPHSHKASPSQKTANPPIRARLSLVSSDQHSNYPKLKRSWSYHPYHPSDGAHLSQTTTKPLTQKKHSPPFGSSAASRRVPPTFCASAPASPVLSSKPAWLTLSATPPYGTTINSPHQNNGCQYRDLLKEIKYISSAKPNFGPLHLVQTQADSTCLRAPTNEGGRCGHEMEPTSTVPDAPVSDLLVSEGINAVLIQSKQGGRILSEPLREREFNTMPIYHRFSPESSTSNYAGALNTNRLEKHFSSFPASFQPFCSSSSSSAGNWAPSLPNVMTSGSDITMLEANNRIPMTYSPSTADSQLQSLNHGEGAVVSPHKGIRDLQESEDSLEDSLKTICVTSPLTTDNLLSANHVKLPKGIEVGTNEVKHSQEKTNNNHKTMTSKAEFSDSIKTAKKSCQTSVPVKDEKVDAEMDLSTPEEEDDANDTALMKIRDNDGNLVVLKSLGRDWLPDVSVCRLSIPDYAPCSPAPVLRVQTEGSNNFHLSVVQEREQDPSCPLLANKVNCAVCKISGILLQCSVCCRAFHRQCHIPPVNSLNNTKWWQCLLCRDLSHVENHEIYPKHDGLSSLSLSDQKKCEYLLLSLTCSKQSSTLNRSVKMPSRADHYVDVTLVRRRLLRQVMPPYRTPAEFVHDVWLLLYMRLTSSQAEQRVKRLQTFFSEELRRVFGQSLHPSLLKDPYPAERETTQKHKYTAK
ncbi:transcription intermediary factor 1-alpha isoform X2 [Brachyhypopomus gauderio]|uniref:transcription intermediary factor 1-alpha isoform X2 n=1 Tax=Brachyhypopomus gauderio TaxID=698409 RepID=UPI0040438684